MPMNKKMHCQFFLTLTPDMLKYVRSKFRGHNVQTYNQILSLEKLNPETEVLGVFVDSTVDKAVFQKLPKLKLILTLSTGFDHIDMNEAKKRKVVVCNVPSYGENTVAEFAMMHILALMRKLFPSVKRVKEGDYDYHGLRGVDMKGKVVGVVGTGKIGLHVIKMLKGFDVTILAFDAFPKKELQKEYGFQYVPLSKLLKESDIVTLHVPLIDSTHHMINKSALKKMKKTAYIVNTARGGIIDSEALVWALEKNEIAGAGLDVLEGEDMLEDTLKLFCSKCTEADTRLSLMNNIIIDHPNTIVTPHNAFNSVEAVMRIIDTSVDNFRSYTNGEIVNNVLK